MELKRTVYVYEFVCDCTHNFQKSQAARKMKDYLVSSEFCDKCNGFKWSVLTEEEFEKTKREVVND